MKFFLQILVMILLTGCGQNEIKSDEYLKTIEVGDYLFDFPTDFELVKEKGIDSYVGKIIGDSLSFDFDFGRYTNDFEQTTQQYLDEGDWRLAVSYRFMKEGIIYDNSNTPKVDVISIRQATINDSVIGKGCDYVAKCKHESTEFEFSIYIPEEIKQMNFKIDTVDNQFRKLVWSKDPHRGTTGLYIRNLNDLDNSTNSYLALAIWTSELNIKEQEAVLRILKTARHKTN